jgi:uncharacterized membrane protein HdeD (DUF308 family)
MDVSDSFKWRAEQGAKRFYSFGYLILIIAGLVFLYWWDVSGDMLALIVGCFSLFIGLFSKFYWYPHCMKKMESKKF